ncbi:MAG: hypothetical protein J7L96_03195, partial [Bacteroidales bacterium]|nr:hypothetical protein [Bacteroidales bacterium]
MKKTFLYDFSDSQPTPSTATLNVKISDYNNLPFVIRKSNFELQGYSKTDRDIILNPGLYIIQVAKPDGGTESKIVNLKEGDYEEVELILSSTNKMKKKNFDLERTYKRKKKRLVKENLDVIIRILFFDGKNWQVEKELLENNNFNTELIDNINHIKINIHASDYLQVLEVRRSKGKSIYLVLPISQNATISTCTVEILDDGVSFQFLCYFEYDKRTTLMLDYLSSNSFEEAADIAGNAEDMLYSKMVNPIGAVIGGYVLLRIGAVEQMHDWPKNLYNWFPKLADGAIIAGELEARRGNDKEAIDMFLEAYNRGLPIFREGLSILVSRLRSYL